MKFLFMLAWAGTLAAQTQLASVKTLYIFPMRSAMDQYLASAITEQHVFDVVSDPKLADAVLTDRVGPAFEESFDRLVLDKKLKNDEMPQRTSVGSSHGTIFMVNRSKRIVWSAYLRPKDGSSEQLEKAARRTADRMKKDLAPVVVTLTAPN